MKRVFTYLLPVWSGDDGKPSIRRLLALALSIDFIISIHTSVRIAARVINLIYLAKPVDAGVISALSTHTAQITMQLGIEASLIAAMLSLTTFQAFKNRTTDQS